MYNSNTVKVEYLFWEPNGTREEGYLDMPAHFTMKQIAECVRSEFNSWVRSKYYGEADDFDADDDDYYDAYAEECYYDYHVCK